MSLFSSTRPQTTDVPKPSLRERLAAATGRRTPEVASPAPDLAPASAAPVSPFDDPATVAWFTAGGLVPFPAAAPQSFVRAENAIRLEAELLLERARSEFARQYSNKIDASDDLHYRKHLPGRLERALRIPELEAAAREPMRTEGVDAYDASDADLVDKVAEVARLDAAIKTMLSRKDAREPDRQPEYLRADARRTALLGIIAGTGAEGLPGLRAKARAIMGQSVRCSYDEQCRLAESLADDLLRMRPGDDVGQPALRRDKPPAPPVVEAINPCPVFARLDAADDERFESALKPGLSPEVQAVLTAVRRARRKLNLDLDETDETTTANTAAVDEACAVLRGVPSRTVADLRAKVSYLLPLMLPHIDPDDGAMLEHFRDDIDQLSTRRAVAAERPSPLSFIDLGSATMSELMAIHSAASTVGRVADMAASHSKPRPGDLPGSVSSGAAHKMMVWLSDALNDVEYAVERECERRTPTDEREREIRLAMIAVPIIESNDPDRIATLAGAVAEHAIAEGKDR